jgi:hypothetical protein
MCSVYCLFLRIDSNALRRPISSAVILPEPEVPKSPRTKRRQSTSSDAAVKRPRLSDDGSAQSPSTLRASPQATDSIKREPSVKVEPDGTSSQQNQDRRKSSVVEEKRRGQRLFGGLLSTLSQSTPNGQQKRRLEIEKKQAEKAKQQKLDDETRKAEKIAKLKEIRRTEQVKFDEESVSIFQGRCLTHAWILLTCLDANRTLQHAGYGKFPIYKVATESCTSNTPLPPCSR